MTTPDPFALARSRTTFTLEEAARLVCDVPLSRRYPAKSAAWTQEQRDEFGMVQEALRELRGDASRLGVTVTHHPTKKKFHDNKLTGELYHVGTIPARDEYGDMTRSALVDWCKEKGLRPAALFPLEGQPASAPAGVAELTALPLLLAVAIEAFQAVRHDQRALAGTSPKKALMAWLQENKPELSNNAREAIAFVANWQPSGGAPKTPIGET